VEVLTTSCGYKLPKGLIDRLYKIYIDNKYAKQQSFRHRFGYTDFLAFQEILNQLPGICNLLDVAGENTNGKISRDDFKVANRVLGLGGNMTRRQVDLVFELFDLDGDGFISPQDKNEIVGDDFIKKLIPREDQLSFSNPHAYSIMEGEKGAQAAALQQHQSVNVNVQSAVITSKPTTVRPSVSTAMTKTKKTSIHAETNTKGFFDYLLDFAEHFALGAIAGGIGAAAVYPIDLVKTRMQNQRIGIDGSRLYQNSWDCFNKTIKSEGVVGLYRGLLPQLVGVAPEKAVKLTVNDMLREAFTVSDARTGQSKIHLPLEILSGGCAGACQVLVTNPLEITKIRLQVQGETARLLREAGKPVPPPQSVMAIGRELGLVGLYKGASACLLRDIPFSAIYFPAYAAFKTGLQAMSNEEKASATTLLVAGAAAGVPAAFFTTPADVIKTRLQVVTREGEMTYTGIHDCATKLYRHEGLSSFFKGSGMRVFRSSPQFGITLLSYEKLSQFFGLEDSAVAPPTNAPVDPLDYRSAFPHYSDMMMMDKKASEMQRLLKHMGFNQLKGFRKED